VEGTIRHEAADPSTGGRVDTEAREGVSGEGGIKVIEKVGNVKEEDGTHLAGLDSLFHLVMKGSGCVRCRMVCARSKLTQSQEVKVVDVRAKVGGDHLLKQLPTALKEGDRPVGLCSSVVWLMGLGNDDNGSGGPRVNTHLQGFPED